MPRWARVCLFALVPLLGAPLALWGGFAALGRTPSGLRVAGEVLPPTGEARPELERRALRWGRERVRLIADDVTRQVRREELGARVDLDALTRRVERRGRSGNPLEDLPALFAAWSGGTDLAWPVRIERAAVRAAVRELANEVDRPPRPAELDSRGRLIELSADGARLQQGAATAALLAALEQGRRAVRLPVERLSSGVGNEALSPVRRGPPPSIVVGRYSTRFETRGGERSRAHNVSTAAGYLDGAVIEPFGRLSFNRAVGARSRERGYRLAHVIVDGEMVDGLGGGVCQVASTLHAAAFLGGLDIVEHSPHSRPSGYIPMGLDATVVWPSVDLVVANPFPFSLTVRASARGGRMVVELRGPRRPRRVDWRREVVRTEPWSDRYVEDPSVQEGERVSQRGIRGFVVLRERTIRDADGLHIEERRLHYPPTDRIIRVPPGTLDPLTGEPAAGPGTLAALPANPF